MSSIKFSLGKLSFFCSGHESPTIPPELICSGNSGITKLCMKDSGLTIPMKDDSYIVHSGAQMLRELFHLLETREGKTFPTLYLSVSKNCEVVFDNCYYYGDK